MLKNKKNRKKERRQLNAKTVYIRSELHNNTKKKNNHKLFHNIFFFYQNNLFHELLGKHAKK